MNSGIAKNSIQSIPNASLERGGNCAFLVCDVALWWRSNWWRSDSPAVLRTLIRSFSLS